MDAAPCRAPSLILILMKKPAMLRMIAASLASAIALSGAFAQTAAELPRIEDFRADLTGAEIEAAQAMRTRNLAAQAYIWGIPAFLNFRQATEFRRPGS